jgi:hypothetical protein
VSASTQRYSQVLENDWRGQVDGEFALGFEESKNLVAASASRYASSAWPGQASFNLRQAWLDLLTILAFGTHIREDELGDMVCGNELQTVRSDVLKKKQS